MCIQGVQQFLCGAEEYFAEKVTFELRTGEVANHKETQGHSILGIPEGIARAKALSREHAWCVGDSKEAGRTGVT